MTTTKTGTKTLDSFNEEEDRYSMNRVVDGTNMNRMRRGNFLYTYIYIQKNNNEATNMDTYPNSRTTLVITTGTKKTLIPFKEEEEHNSVNRKWLVTPMWVG